MRRNIAVIGAGISGLGAASVLTEAGHDVKIFEKSRGVSGRAASRSREGCRYDHGANYFTLEKAEARSWLVEHSLSNGLIEIGGSVMPFDKAGEITAPDSERGDSKRYSYREGISHLGKNVRRKFDLEIVHQIRIVQLSLISGRWTLTDDQGASYPGYDAVLVTAPLPQASELIARSGLDRKISEPTLNAFSEADYFSQYSVALNWGGKRQLPGGPFALINSDGEHPVSWVSDESFKGGHVPGNETLFIVQMSPEWSADRVSNDPSEIACLVFSELKELLAGELPEPQWGDVQWWRYARPGKGSRVVAPAPAASAGLYFAGDGFADKGSVEGALL